MLPSNSKTKWRFAEQKKGRFISNKEKTRRMARTSWASNLRKTEKKTEFAPVTENNLLDGTRIMNMQEIMRQLLQGCSDCGNGTRLLSETKSGLGSYFYISCECGVLNIICSGKRHSGVNTDKIQHRKAFFISTRRLYLLSKSFHIVARTLPS